LIHAVSLSCSCCLSKAYYIVMASENFFLHVLAQHQMKTLLFQSNSFQ
jgi:hypothetical protein